ncbi:MAG: DMT family transporter [Chloroflexi bacterium]|nr:DMT family transporter [Chloroflexota bacterium]
MEHQTTTPIISTRPNLNTPLLVVALLTVDGLHFVFARALRDHLPPTTSVLYVLGLGTLQVALFAIARGRFRFSTFRRHLWFFLAIGALVATGTSINYAAVVFVDPGTASLLAETSILFGVGFGVWWLRDRLTRAQWLGGLVCIAGVAVITFQPGDYLRLGSVMVIGSAFIYALHAAIVKRYGADIEFVEFFLWRLMATTGFLFLSATAQGMLLWPDGQAWLLILLVATVDIIISRTLYYLALRRLTISFLSLLLTVSPIVAILWSVALFKSQPTPRELLGGAAVLVGIAIVTSRRS